MKIERIEIQTSNKKYRTDLAMLVDSPKFLKKIQELRIKWDISKLFNSFEEFIAKNIWAEGDKIAEKKLAKFNKDIDALLEVCKRDRGFKKAVEYALVTGIIPEHIYRGCYFDVVTIGEPEDLSHPEKYQYAIIMSPRTELKEVEQAYKDFQLFIKGYWPKNDYEDPIPGKIDFHHSSYNIEIPGDKDEIEHFLRGFVYDSADIDKFKTLKELERTREWYWMRFKNNINDSSQKPVPCIKVFDEWKERCPDKQEHLSTLEEKECPYCSVDSWNDIEQALNSYTKLLKLS